MSGRRKRGKDDDGWSENGASFADWTAGQGYDAGAAAMMADVGGVGVGTVRGSRHASLLATEV